MSANRQRGSSPPRWGVGLSLDLFPLLILLFFSPVVIPPSLAHWLALSLCSSRFSSALSFSLSVVLPLCWIETACSPRQRMSNAFSSSLRSFPRRPVPPKGTHFSHAFLPRIPPNTKTSITVLELLLSSSWLSYYYHLIFIPPPLHIHSFLSHFCLWVTSWCREFIINQIQLLTVPFTKEMQY